MTGQLALSWRQRAPTKCQALRDMMETGQWHSHKELTLVGGARFGARLLEIRTGEDGGESWLIEKRSVGGDVLFEYRFAGYARPRRRSVSDIAADIRKHRDAIARLAIELERVSAGDGR